MVTKLEQAREAQRQIDEQKRLADELPKLEAEERRRVDIDNAAAREQIAVRDLTTAMTDYNRQKRERDTLLTQWLADGAKLIKLGQKFDNLCNGTKNSPYPTKGIDDFIAAVALAQLEQLAPRNRIDDLAISERKQQIAKEMGILPLCKFNGDRSGVKQHLLDLLAKHIALNW